MKLVAAIHLILVFAACTVDVPASQDNNGGAALDDDQDTGSTDEPTMPELPPGPMTSIELSESNDELVNPERGYYVGFDPVNDDSTDAARVRAKGSSLAIALVNLEAYRDSSIDSAFLAKLDAGFERARAAGFKIILRFVYNKGYEADASRSRILGHLEQLAPIVHDNADVIAVVQAGLIGAWGEWHSSTNDLENDEDRAAILDGLLSAVPSNRQVAVRTPMYKEAYVGDALSADEAYSSDPRARLGHHNDCFLASASDYGTYASPVTDWSNYVAQDGQYTAIGGETCAVYTAKTTCEASVAEMQKLHWSYLNSEYNLSVLDGWEAQGCADEINNRMGYRFAFDTVSHSESVAPGGELGLEIELHNSGFASPYNQRPVEIVLTNGSVRHTVALSGHDARRWAAGEHVTLRAKLRVPADLAAGQYTVALRLPDASGSIANDARYAIRFANDGTWDESTGDNVLTRSLVVDAAAPGPRDTTATTFVELP
jgi:hypothetical protein